MKNDDWSICLLFCYLLQDERFNKEVDAQTGYRTHSLVCMPVCNYDGEVIGVAQIINKRGGCNNHEFTETDLKVNVDKTQCIYGTIFCIL